MHYQQHLTVSIATVATPHSLAIVTGNDVDLKKGIGCAAKCLLSHLFSVDSFGDIVTAIQFVTYVICLVPKFSSSTVIIYIYRNDVCNGGNVTFQYHYFRLLIFTCMFNIDKLALRGYSEKREL